MMSLRTSLRVGLGVLAMWVAASAGAQVAPTDVAAERARLARERASIDSLHEQRVAACQSRFAVTGCIEAARKTHREALRQLRAQGLKLDDGQRQRRAELRRQSLRDKSGMPPTPALPAASATGKSSRSLAPRTDEQNNPAPIPVRPVKPALRTPPAPETLPDIVGADDPVGEKARPKVKPEPHRQRSAGEAKARLEREKLDRDKLERRQRELGARREAVERRHAERLRTGKVAQPLPVAPAAAASQPGSGASR